VSKGAPFPAPRRIPSAARRASDIAGCTLISSIKVPRTRSKAKRLGQPFGPHPGARRSDDTEASSTRFRHVIDVTDARKSIAIDVGRYQRKREPSRAEGAWLPPDQLGNGGPWGRSKSMDRQRSPFHPCRRRCLLDRLRGSAGSTRSIGSIYIEG
jgi:hypothetical protein